jgi:glycosyltransferase involved in cell wall biosynthesis
VLTVPACGHMSSAKPIVKLPISVCIIANNEAHRIGNTLKSVAGWTSEIVAVINHDVSDGTDKVIESFGGKVYREPWRGFVGQNQSATDKATGEWLLSIDADEVISPELAAEIQACFARPETLNRLAGFEFPRVSMFYGRWIRHGEWYPDRKLRLWKRGQGKWGGAAPHSRVIVNGPVGRLKGEMFHYSMESLEHLLQKTVRYADDFVATCRQENRRVTFGQMVIRPPWRFLRGYVFKLGFLDGWRGLAIAWMAAFYTFLRYLKAYQAQTGEDKP